MAIIPALETNPATNFHLMAAAVVATALMVVTLAALVFSGGTFHLNPSFVPAVGCMTLLSDFLTGILLLANAIVVKDRRPVILGAAYLLSFLLLSVHLAAFPGVISANSLIGNNESSMWLWCFWQGGFPAVVTFFAFAKSSPLRSGDLAFTIAAMIGTTFVLTAVATEGFPWLPVLLRNSRYTGAVMFGIGPLLFMLIILAFGSVMFKCRMRDTVSVWLSLAMLASVLNITLILAGGGRFTFDWYLARLLNLVVGVAVLVALLSDLINQSRQILVINQRLQNLIVTDPLTGIGNRLALDQGGAVEWKRARREQTDLSMLMIDIDFFKSFNDCYGHPAGDRCIAAVGAVIGQQVKRPADLAVRFGGEEFVVLLPNTDKVGAFLLADRMLKATLSLGLRHADNPIGQVTISVGVATCRPSSLVGDIGQLMDEADQALYQAKSDGRNRVCVKVNDGLTPALAN